LFVLEKLIDFVAEGIIAAARRHEVRLALLHCGDVQGFEEDGFRFA
jgi:hypothetical protein